MTRHGLLRSCVAASPLRRSADLALDLVGEAPPVHVVGHAAAIILLRPASAKILNPHNRDLHTAGSFFQDFRTPSAPETLKAQGFLPFRLRDAFRDNRTFGFRAGTAKEAPFACR